MADTCQHIGLASSRAPMLPSSPDHPNQDGVIITGRIHLITHDSANCAKRTITQIQLLEESERIEELASMLRGEARGETTRQEAAAMLEAARRCW